MKEHFVDLHLYIVLAGTIITTLYIFLIHLTVYVNIVQRAKQDIFSHFKSQLMTTQD